MAIFIVSFTRTFDVTVEASSRAELEKCVHGMSEYDVRELADGSEWEASVCEPHVKHAVVFTPDLGLLDGDLVHIDDYRAAHEDDPAPEPVDTRTLPLPGVL